MRYPCRILVLFAHPAFHRSRIHRRLAQAAQSVEGVTFNDLYEVYPDFQMDIDREQRLILEHDLVIFQHPFYWYSTPAILKEWQDLVLEYGFAYGDGGTALNGKRLMSVLSAGGPEDAYQPEGYNVFTVRQLLAPIEQTAKLCGMEYLPPFIVHGSHGLDATQIDAHTSGYTRLLTALRDGALDWERARPLHRINADLASLLSPASR